jgi:undecaprenyl-diphosphatase
VSETDAAPDGAAEPSTDASAAVIESDDAVLLPSGEPSDQALLGVVDVVSVGVPTGVLPTPDVLPAVQRFDEVVDEWFDAIRHREPLDRIVYAVSELGDFGLIWLVIGAAKSTRNDRNFGRGLRLFGVMAAESVVMNGFVKSLFKRERPVFAGERPHKLRIPRTTSFPSGHSSSAFLAAALLAEENPRLRRAYYALAFFMGASRVHVRIHHASDVISGAVVGAALGVAAKRLWPVDAPPVLLPELLDLLDQRPRRPSRSGRAGRRAPA